jgi:hypothetical protein
MFFVITPTKIARVPRNPNHDAMRQRDRTMSRKDYIKAADQIRTQRLGATTLKQRQIIDALQQSLADLFRADNPRFDRTRFDAACQPAVGEGAANA